MLSVERRHKRILDELFILADDVEVNDKSNNRYRLAAAIVKNRKVLSYGINRYKKTHPLQAKHKKHFKANYPCAEVCAIINAKNRYGEDALKGAILYIARTKFADATKSVKITGLAAPCVGCRAHVKAFGISQIVYTTDTPSFTCEVIQ